MVFVIVEGPSDETALGIALNQVFDKEAVYVHIMHGDITSRKGVSSDNIVAKLGNELRAYAKANHFSQKDFQEIIHIVDTDGVYIPEEKVLEDKNAAEIRYESEGIYTMNREMIIRRNKQKTDNLFRLRNTGQIWKIPYRVYYMSCNLDHVLYNKRNSTEEDKENDAYTFAKRYRNDLEGFIQYICESSFSVNGDYKNSWLHIEEEMNSLERYTNLSICIVKEIDKRIDGAENKNG